MGVGSVVLMLLLLGAQAHWQVGSMADAPFERNPVVLSGTCDASAAVFVRPGLLLVAGDEDNVLRLYQWPGPPFRPILRFPLDQWIVADPDHPEADLEAVTWLNGRLVWAGSHGRSKEGKFRINRHCLLQRS